MSEIENYLTQILEEIQTEQRETLSREIQLLEDFKTQISTQVEENSQEVMNLLERFEELHTEIITWEQSLKNSAASYKELVTQLSELHTMLKQIN